MGDALKATAERVATIQVKYFYSYIYACRRAIVGVFLTEHPHFHLCPPILLDSPKRAIPTTLEAKNMRKSFNEPNYSFLVEAFNDEGQRLTWFRIDQVVANPSHSHQVDSVTNAVERHLHYLHERLGLNYSCFAQGPIEEIDKCIEANNIELD